MNRVGVTRIGGYHLDVLRRMRQDGDLELVAAVDPALARLPELRERHAVYWPFTDGVAQAAP